MNLSFSGCGFLGIYHIGVASCIREHAPGLLTVHSKIAGASAGAIAACCLITGCELGQCTSFVLRLATKARSKTLGPLHPTFNIVKILRDGLDEILPINAHEIANGRLYISLTRVSDRQNVMISEFESRHDLLQALICSTFVPFYCGLIPPIYQGVRYVDGGLSDNVPSVTDDSVTVSPFAGESDICPSDCSANFLLINLANTSIQLNSSNLYRLSRALFPPHPEILSDMCQQGFDDTLRYLQRNNLVTCTRHLSIQSCIYPVPTVVDIPDAPHCHYEDDDADCEECKHKLKMALLDSLPPAVVTSLQTACDSVNNGLLAYVYNSTLFHVVSVMAQPWILPADVTYNICVRFLHHLPHIPDTIQAMVAEAVDLLRAILWRLQHHQSKYTARFSCQLAITELNYGQLHCPHVSVSNDRVRNLNIGFAVDFKTSETNTFRSLRDLESHMDRVSLENIDIKSHHGTQHLNLQATGHHASQDAVEPCQEIFDTFDQCLEVSGQHESVMAYYYQDENDHKIINVREIFSLPKEEIDIPQLDTSSDLAWDSYLEMKPEQSDPGSSSNLTDLEELSFDLPESSFLELSLEDNPSDSGGINPSESAQL